MPALGWKAWRESRARFALSAAALAGLCLALVVFQAYLRRLIGATEPPATTYVGYLHMRLYASVGCAVFWLIAIVLGLGGLARERTHGTLGFTLALPVPRSHHAIARAAVGVLELAALALVPVVIVPSSSSWLVGERYPWSQAVGFAALWFGVGSVGFAVSFAISVIVRSDYVALAVAVLTLRLVPSAVALIPGLERWRPLDVRSGRGQSYFDPATAMLTCVPWPVAAAALVAAGALITIAVQLARQERFA